MKNQWTVASLGIGLALAAPTLAQQKIVGRVGAPLTLGDSKVTIRNIRNQAGTPQQQPPQGYHYIAFEMRMEAGAGTKVTRAPKGFEGVTVYKAVTTRAPEPGVISQRQPAPVLRGNAPSTPGVASGPTTITRTTTTAPGPGMISRPEPRPTLRGNAPVTPGVVAQGSGGKSSPDTLAMLADPVRVLGASEARVMSKKGLAPGEAFTWTVVALVPNTEDRAAWLGFILLQPQGRAPQKLNYEIDLGTLPPYTAPAEVSVAVGELGTLFGYQVKVTGAATGTPKANPLRSTSPDTVAVIVSVEHTNPLPEAIAHGAHSVVLEDRAGTVYSADLFAGRLPSQTRPGKTTKAALTFLVPAAKLGELKARFNPAIGYGNVVVPLTGLQL
ncbi:hypothetical protein [Armatimonas rosea]|uniref:Uncharacterized protein n=1 Tax=Armatimonas rosea TaxID=685828 RepID=A0A7W9W4K3_ARMRO|nr:hypothetical protein [Armatimonas rosea]MBB6048603.1 hypothetical protein [Armatimonas rosea]